MLIHEDKLRKAEVSPYLSSVHGQRYVDWHRKAKEEGIKRETIQKPHSHCQCHHRKKVEWEGIF